MPGSKPVIRQLAGVVQVVFTHALAGPATGHVAIVYLAQGPPGGGVMVAVAVVEPVGLTSTVGELQGTCEAFKSVKQIRYAYLGHHSSTSAIVTSKQRLQAVCMNSILSFLRKHLRRSGGHKVQGVGHRGLAAIGQAAKHANLILQKV